MTSSRCCRDSSLRTQAAAPARSAATMRSASAEQLSMMMRGAPSRPDRSSHRRFAPWPGRSASSRMTAAWLPAVRHDAGADI